jgi:hypothetical protein
MRLECRGAWVGHMGVVQGASSGSVVRSIWMGPVINL